MIARLWAAITGLSRERIRSLFAVAMLCGIAALSAQGWAYVALLHHSAGTPEAAQLFGVLSDALKWTFMLIGMLALCVVLVVFNADYLRFKYGETEFGAGRGNDDES